MLTIKQVEKLKGGEKSYKVSDGNGLYLFVDVSGGRYWRYNYRDPFTGKQKTKSYGVWPKLSIMQARLLHAEFKDGHSSNQTRSFIVIVDDYIDTRYANVSRHHRRKLDSIINNHVPKPIQDKPIGSFTRRDWVELVKSTADKGVVYTSHQLAQLISRVNDYAVDIGEVESHKASGLTRVLPAQKEVQHRAALTDNAEHAEFFGKLYNYSGDERTRLGTLLLALTLTRTNEVRWSKWSEFDLNTKTWTIDKTRMKSNRDHLVPITPEIEAVLNLLRKINGDHEYVLASPRNPLKPVSENTFIYAIYRMGYHSRMTGHGLRAMASTWLNEKQYFSPAIEAQLAHKERDKSKAAYDRAKHWNERIEIMKVWSKYVMRLFNKN